MVRRPTPASGAIRLAARTEGLLLDPVYSGKAMAGLMAMPLSELQVTAVVFLATGGVPALFETRYEDWLAGDPAPAGVSETRPADAPPPVGSSYGRGPGRSVTAG